ncbi:MAG: iron ABC transporter permease, partial [Clostridia bacterium]|nr:iron ABC transporter permease [Clostridia bacterium]
MLLLFALLLFMLLLNLLVGSVRMTPAEIRELLKSGRDASTESIIIFNVRMPRMLLAAILGGALAVSGFLLQSFFRNPIAGPFVLGISSGAKMIVGITMIFLAGSIDMSPASLVVAAFAGSIMITAVVLLFSQKVKSMELLLVVGIMVGYICSAVTDMAVTFASEQDIVNLKYWSMGTFSGKGWEQVVTAAIVCTPTLIASWLLSKPMGAYALGEGYAKSMGVAVKPFRLVLILLSSLLSAC